MSPRNHAAARERMIATIEEQARASGPDSGRPRLSARVLDAMRRVPREVFVPPGLPGGALRAAGGPGAHGLSGGGRTGGRQRGAPGAADSDPGPGARRAKLMPRPAAP